MAIVEPAGLSARHDCDSHGERKRLRPYRAEDCESDGGDGARRQWKAPASMTKTKAVGFAMLLVVTVSGRGSAEPNRLIDAVKARNHGIVRTLLQQHADVNFAAADGTTPLYWAAHNDDLDTVKLVI